MQAILAVTIPFFALVLCGYLAGRQKVLPEAAIPGLNTYVLYFALPCMLFRFGAGMPLAQLLNPAVLLVYTASALLIVFFTIAITLNKRVKMKDAAFGALVAAFPNTGFMGVPLMAALLGDAAAGPVLSMVLADLFVTSSLCIALAQSGAGEGKRHDGGAGTRAAAWRAVRGALSNPLPWSIALGALFSVAALRLPGPIQSVVDMLGASATPVALFTIGTVMWRAGQHASGNTPLKQVLPVTLIKLFVHPTLVLLLGLAARELGAPLSLFQITVLTLASALPSASNVSLLAERFGADNGRIANIILASTVLAFGSFSALAWMFDVQPR